MEKMSFLSDSASILQIRHSPFRGNMWYFYASYDFPMYIFISLSFICVLDRRHTKNMAVSTIIDMKCSFTPNCCWRAVRTEFFRIWWNFKHINHTNCTLFCHLTSILLQRFIGESSLTAIFLSIGTAVPFTLSQCIFFLSLSRCEIAWKQRVRDEIPETCDKTCSSLIYRENDPWLSSAYSLYTS